MRPSVEAQETVAALRRLASAYRARADVPERGIPRESDVDTLGVVDVAYELDISPRAVRALARRGSLPASKDRLGSWVFRVDDVRNYIDRRKEAA